MAIHKLITGLFLLPLLFPGSSMAKSKEAPVISDSSRQTHKHAHIKVKGMVCPFCAQGIEKNFKSQPEVKSIKVDLDSMMVAVSFHQGKSLSPEKMKKVITDAGFKFVKATYE